VLPGFVAVLVAERTYEVPVRQRTPFELLLLTAYYSVISYGVVAVASWPFGLSRTKLERWYHQESLGRLGALSSGPARPRLRGCADRMVVVFEAGPRVSF
jgi:hypothetical protein